MRIGYKVVFIFIGRDRRESVLSAVTLFKTKVEVHYKVKDKIKD
jgi:hypothetical protein